MDCDTTGIEPDFALVKYKKLSGGGYFKIINQAIPQSLKNLKYKKNEIEEIVNYAKGHGTFKGAPGINHDTLKAKGFTKVELDKIEGAAAAAFEIGFVFNHWALGEEFMAKLNIPIDVYEAQGFDMLSHLGFTAKEINACNAFVTGKMTIEGAPHLKEEHYEIFDCANRCGEDGKRFIHAHAHIKMMAAAQPFISGAISKTINLPNEATQEEIASCYELSWSLGLKANALYRDGCKLSQPLSNKSETKKEEAEGVSDEIDVVENAVGEKAEFSIDELTPDMVLEAAVNIINKSKDTTFKRQLSRIVERKKLPNKRQGFTQKAKVGAQTIFVRTGQYSDGTLGEIFIDMHKEGASFRSLMNCFSIAISIGLQYGVPLEEYVNKFAFTRFEPSGMVDGHPNIKNATSIVDYIFRLLGFEYLKREDLVQVKPQKIVPIKPMNDAVAAPIVEELKPAPVLESNGKVFKGSEPLADGLQEHMRSMQSDSPACDNCGHITVRSGTCYKCLNCGNSLGCS